MSRCKVLCEVAEGVCCRAYYLKEKMSARTCMTTPDFAKIRQKLDRSFPDIVEAQKVTSILFQTKIQNNLRIFYPSRFRATTL